MLQEIKFQTFDSSLLPKKFFWLTDLHLDAASPDTFFEFLKCLEEKNPDALLIGGDICNGPKAFSYLKEIQAKIKKTIYYVLGNHDYYHGSIANIRQTATFLTREFPELIYLTSNGIYELSKTTALIGHDGWADGQAGNFLRSHVLLNDYFYIEELKGLSPSIRLQKLKSLGEEAATYLETNLSKALEKYQKVLLLTHVPPFREACRWEGRMSDDDWAPHFVGFQTGERLVNLMQKHPKLELIVLCGHSHQPANVTILPNLTALAGESHLGLPQIQGIVFV